MSDGENATPDQGGAPDPRGDERTARSSHPASARAPWERVPAPTGNHSEGVPVADLIAKVTGGQGINPVTRRSVDVTAPAEDATVPIAVADEIPDLAALARHRRPLVADANPAIPPPPRRSRPPAPPGTSAPHPHPHAGADPRWCWAGSRPL